MKPKKSRTPANPMLGMPVEIPEALGQSQSFLEFRERLSRVAPINRPVLLIGERGTGKELAASRLHFLSARWQGPLVALNCSALTASLIETELFGFEKGAFTGATERRRGRFESADGGTLFLDEIGNIPAEVQEKILRVVEYGSFERVGSSESVKVDVRIIAATNTDLVALAEEGRFKKDLLDRLSFEVILLPPLKERKEDILLLANHFAARMAHELGWREIPRFTDETVKALERYSWPGNVRELKNVVERAVYRSDTTLIEEITFNPFHPWEVEGLMSTATRAIEKEKRLVDDLTPRPLKEAVQELEVHLIKKALVQARHNQQKAARQLGLSYHQFRGMYRKYKREVEEE
jgi:psp operon transcriptional activator